MRLTTKLLDYLHSAFDKDPDSFTAIRIRHELETFNWIVLDRLLTGYLDDLEIFSVDLSGHTIRSLVGVLSSVDGINIIYTDPDNIDISATALLDGQGRQDESNGDILRAYKSLTWMYLDAMATELAEAKQRIYDMLDQIYSLRAADDEWLDEWGGYFDIPRISGENDITYGNRIIAEVIRPRGNNRAIEAALLEKYGQASTVNNIVQWGGPDPAYNGAYDYDGVKNHNASAAPRYGLFEIVVGYDLFGSGSPPEFIQEVGDFIDRLRDAGTHLNAVVLSSSGIIDNVPTSPVDSDFILGVGHRPYYNGVYFYNGEAGHAFALDEPPPPGPLFISIDLAETGADVFAASTIAIPDRTATFAATETGADVFSATGTYIPTRTATFAATETGVDVFMAQTSSGTLFPSGRPVGIYSLLGPGGGSLIVNKSFMSGAIMRTGWELLNPSENNYNFSSIGTMISQLEAVGQSMSLIVFAIDPPTWVLNGSVTFNNGIYGLNPVPWDEFALSKWEKFCIALGDYVYGGYQLRNHPTVKQVDCGIIGTQGVRLTSTPSGYTATKYKDACLRSVRAMTTQFPQKNLYVGMFGVMDGISSPKTEVTIRDAMLSEFNGITSPKINFYQETWSGNTPSAQTGGLIYDARNNTSIMLQACGEFSNQSYWTWCNFATNDQLGTAINYAITNFNTTYFEIYVKDLNYASYQSVLTQAAIDIVNKYNELEGGGSGVSTIGFVGASMSMNAIDGAVDLGDTRFWGNVTAYSSGGIWQWAQNLTNSSAYWAAFNTAYQARPTTTFWLQLAALEAFAANETYTNALAIVNQIKTRSPGAIVYVSAQPTYIPTNHVCTIAGANGPARMQTIANQLVTNGHCFAGPVVGPLAYPSQTSDACHANAAGEALMGQQLIDFFDAI